MWLCLTDFFFLWNVTQLLSICMRYSLVFRVGKNKNEKRNRHLLSLMNPWIHCDVNKDTSKWKRPKVHHKKEQRTMSAHTLMCVCTRLSPWSDHVDVSMHSHICPYKFEILNQSGYSFSTKTRLTNELFWCCE